MKENRSCLHNPTIPKTQCTLGLATEISELQVSLVNFNELSNKTEMEEKEAGNIRQNLPLLVGDGIYPDTGNLAIHNHTFARNCPLDTQ